jgi:integrase
MGRRRLYATNSARQRAYVQRTKKESVQILSDEKSKANILRIHTQWAKRTQKEVIKNAENAAGELVFLMKKITSDKKQFSVVRRWRSANGTEAEFVDYCDYSNAFDDYSSLVHQTVYPERWLTVDHYLDAAEIFIKNYSKNTERLQFAHIPKKIAFLFAVAEKIENGYGKEVGSKSGSEAKSREIRNLTRRTVLREIGNEDIIPLADNNSEQVTMLISQWFQKITDVAIEDECTESTYEKKCNIIIECLTLCFRKFPRAFQNLSTLGAICSATKVEIKNKNKGKLKRNKHHEPIVFGELREFLDVVWQYGIDLYLYCILALTLGLRPTELRRLLKNKRSFINSEGELNYKGTQLLDRNRIEDDEFLKIDPLIKKTIKKIDPSTLTNPQLSLVARIILLNFELNLDDKIIKNFFSSEKSFRKKYPHLKNIYERRFRTTCATEICTTSSNIDCLYIAQARMGHSDVNTLTKIYAKKKNNQKNPKSYFMHKGEIIVNGFDIAKGSLLFDTVLLQNLIDKFEDKFNSENTERNKLWDIILTEACALQRITGDSELNNIETKVYNI